MDSPLLPSVLTAALLLFFHNPSSVCQASTDDGPHRDTTFVPNLLEPCQNCRAIMWQECDNGVDVMAYVNPLGDTVYVDCSDTLSYDSPLIDLTDSIPEN